MRPIRISVRLLEPVTDEIPHCADMIELRGRCGAIELSFEMSPSQLQEAHRRHQVAQLEWRFC